MATDIVIPSLGESISEGVIASWLKKDGDSVERDEPIIELETDKITMEVPAPAAGIVHPKAKEGDTVAVGEVVGSIDESKDAGGGGDAKKKRSAAKSKEEDDSGDKATATKSRKGDDSRDADSDDPDSAMRPGVTRAGEGAVSQQRREESSDDEEDDTDGVRATPLARKLAKEHGVKLSRVSPTGPGGRIREHDVMEFVKANGDGGGAKKSESRERDSEKDSGRADDRGKPDESPRSGAAFSRDTSRKPMSKLRQTIAARLVEAQQTAAMLTTFNECDMSKVMALRSRYKDDFEKKHGVRLGFMSFFVRACVQALQAYPQVNSQIVKGEKGPEIQSHDYCDIAMAVSTPKGLVVPVLRNCESLSMADVEKGINKLAANAREGKLTLEDMQGGTFTITNGGIYGSMMSTPILNPPQSGILGMHNIVRRPVENPDKPGSSDIVVRPMMYLALSYDHRIIDGAEAVQFLVAVKRAIEDPERLLLEV